MSKSVRFRPTLGNRGRRTCFSRENKGKKKERLWESVMSNRRKSGGDRNFRKRDQTTDVYLKETEEGDKRREEAVLSLKTDEVRALSKKLYRGIPSRG